MWTYGDLMTLTQRIEHLDQVVSTIKSEIKLMERRTTTEPVAIRYWLLVELLSAIREVTN